MELNIPYINPRAYLNSLTQNYNFIENSAWNSVQIVTPDEIASGGLLLFIRNDFHFIRGKWNFKESTHFISNDPVGEKGMVDLRIDKPGQLRSACIQGDKQFEWDITEVDGFRFFIPEKYFSIKNQHVSECFRIFCEHPNIQNLQNQIIQISPMDLEKSMLLESKMLEFLFYWLEFQKTFEIDQHFEKLSDKTRAIVQNARDIIHENLQQTITIKEICRKVGINEFDLKKNFKKMYGLPIHQYLIKEKLEQSRQMIIHTDLPISEICHLYGYNNRGHYANLYRRFFGLSPLQDRMKQ